MRYKRLLWVRVGNPTTKPLKRLYSNSGVLKDILRCSGGIKNTLKYFTFQGTILDISLSKVI